MGEYTVENVRKKKRGTEIILYLKEDSKEFANLFRLKSICHNILITFPYPSVCLSQRARQAMRS